MHSTGVAFSVNELLSARINVTATVGGPPILGRAARALTFTVIDLSAAPPAAMTGPGRSAARCSKGRRSTTRNSLIPDRRCSGAESMVTNGEAEQPGP